MEYAYAALILKETGEEINETNLTAVLDAAGAAVEESRTKALVAALEDLDLGAIEAGNGAGEEEPARGGPIDPLGGSDAIGDEGAADGTGDDEAHPGDTGASEGDPPGGA